MANQYWVGSDTSWNTAANWASSSGGSDATGPPGSGDDVIFDGGGTNNCTLDTSPTINSIDVQSGYTGLLDFSDASRTVAVGDVTLAGSSSTIDLGNSDWTVTGNWNSASLSSVTVSPGQHIDLAGTSKTYEGVVGCNLRSVTISGSYTTTTQAPSIIGTTLTVSGTWTNNGGNTFVTADVVLTSSGTVQGTTTFSFMWAGGGNTIDFQGGTWDVACGFRRGSTFRSTTAGLLVFQKTVNFSQATATNYTNTFEDDCQFNGDVNITGSTGLTYTFDLGTNNVNLEFRGSVTVSTSGATLVWTKGSGTITFAGGNSQNVDFNDLTIEDIVVGKSAGTLTFTGGFTTDSYTQNTAASTVDFGDVGETYVISGDFDASVTSGNIDFGAGNTINIYGNYNSTGMAGYGTGSSYVQFYGTSKTWRNPSVTGAKFHRFMAGSSYTTGNTSGLNTGGTIEVNGTFTVNHTLVISVGHVIVGASGHLGGSGTVNNTGGDLDNSSGGTWDVATTWAGQFNKCDIVNNSVFSGTSFNWRITSTGSPTLSPPANVEFDCNVTINSTSTGVLTVDCSTNNTAFIFKGNVTLDNTNFIWTKGSGSMTFSGANDQSVNLYDNTVEDIVINKSAGRVTFTGGCTTDSFAGTNGDVDLNGQTITVNVGPTTFNRTTGFRFHDGVNYDMSNGKFIINNGNLTFTGANGNLLYIENLDFEFNSAGSPSATYTHVTNSQKTGTGSDIIAYTTYGNVDNGSNSGWDFIEAVINQILAFGNQFKTLVLRF